MDKRWEALLQKADIKLKLTKSKIVVLKMKEDFMILTADVSSMSPQVKATHTMFCADILKELGLSQMPRTATRMVVDDDEMREVDPDEIQDGVHDTHVQDGGGHDAHVPDGVRNAHVQHGGHADTYCDIDTEGL